MKKLVFVTSFLLAAASACHRDDDSKAPNTTTADSRGLSEQLTKGNHAPQFEPVTVNIENFAQACANAQSVFNTTDAGRQVPISFKNYKGYDQVSEAMFKLTSVDKCEDDAPKALFSMERTDAAGIRIDLVFDKKANNQYELSFLGSDCVRKFVEYSVPLMKEEGIQFTPQFEQAFLNNLIMEYCPKVEAGLTQELIKVLQQP